MKIRLFPRTKWGVIGLCLCALWPLVTAFSMTVMNLFYPDIPAGNSIIEDLTLRPFFAGMMLFGITSCLLSFPTNLFAIFKKGERSLLSFIATLLGLFLIILLIGETVIKH